MFFSYRYLLQFSVNYLPSFIYPLLFNWSVYFILPGLITIVLVKSECNGLKQDGTKQIFPFLVTETVLSLENKQCNKGAGKKNNSAAGKAQDTSFSAQDILGN